MQARPLGRSGLHTAPLARGGNVFGWTADEAASFDVLDAFVDGGFTLIDTADAYTRWVPGHVGGESEAVIGRWLQSSGKRSRVLIATKVGLPMCEPGEGIGPLMGEAGMRILAALDEVAATHGATPAQVALAWQMAQPGITAPIASATSVAQLDELMAATRLTLSPAGLARLGTASTP